MKSTLFMTLLILFFVSTVYLPLSDAQDYQTWGLPDGAKLRLGKGRTNQIVYSPDGTRLAVSSHIGVWIYDTETGEELHLLFDENSPLVQKAAFSPDGNTIASGAGGTIHLWDTNTGEHLQSITAHTPLPGRSTWVTNLAFSPDGNTIASTGYHDRTIRLWDVATGAHLRTLEHPYYPVNRVVFSPDGNTIASVEVVDYDIYLWDTNTGEHLQTLTAQASRLSSEAFSPDGNTLAIRNATVENRDRLGIIMWDVATDTHLRTLAEDHHIGEFAFSPDGNTLAIVIHNEGIGLWDVNTGERLRTVATHPEGFIDDGVIGIAFSTDGILLCSTVDPDWNIHLWGSNTNRHQLTLTRDIGNVRNAVFSPDGSLLAEQGDVSTIRVWDANTGEHLRTLTGDTTEQTGEYYDPSQQFHSVMFNHDGSLLAGTSRGRAFRDARSDAWMTRMWDTNTGRLLHMFTNQFIYVTALSPDGSLLAGGNEDRIFRVWDANTGENLQTLTADGNRNVRNVVFSPDGSLLAISWNNNTTSLWDVATGETLQTLTGAARVWFSPDGSLLAGSRRVRKHRYIDLWDVATGEHLRTVATHREPTYREWVRHITFSPDGSLLVNTGSFSREVVNTDRPHHTITGHTNDLASPRFMSDGSLLVVDGVGIGLWDVNTGEHLRILTEHTNKKRSNFVGFSAFSPDGSLLAGSGPFSKILCLWDANTGKLLRTLTGHTTNVRSVMFSPDGNTLASGDGDGTIHLWDANTWKLLRTLTGHTTVVVSMAFSPDGDTLTSGGFRDPDIRVWDANTAEHLRTLTEHTLGSVNSVVFSPDGSLLASGGADATVRVWDSNTWEHLRTLTGHTFSPISGGVNSVAFSPDGNTLASAGSTERSIRLWDVATGAHLRTLEGHKFYFDSVAFSPDGNTLVSTGQSIGLLWEITPTSQHPGETAADVNGDGIVNIQDLISVAGKFSADPAPDDPADVNNDGAIDKRDLIAVDTAMGEAAGAPTVDKYTDTLTRDTVQRWLTEAQSIASVGPMYLRGIAVLQQLLLALTPKETVLLPNYPNPFNPETWIPYQLAKPADVTFTIHTVDGSLVRALDLGHQRAGIYQSRTRAAHWDGRNTQGEPVASGVYFYTFKAGDFSATRKMLILK